MSKRKTILWDTCMIVAIVGVIVLVAYKMNGIYPFGEASIARGDMVQQTIPAGMYYVWDVLHGQASPFFAWDSAYGMNISGASSLGALMSPLNLFLYFTTRSNIVYFANILLILKMVSIAVAMYFYLRKYDASRLVHIVGGVVYAFGAASLVHFQIIMVMDAAFLLPFLMMGIDRIFKNRGCRFFILALALSMMVNVYTGCITLVFVFLSCGLRNLWEIETREERKRCALHLGVSVVMGLLLSAIVTIPALRSISETSRISLSMKDTYKYAIESQWQEYEWETVKRMLVSTALPASTIVYFLLRKLRAWGTTWKKNRCHIGRMILLVLSVCVSGIELLWHGGTRASWPVRFVYVISFALVDFAVDLCAQNRNWLEEKKVSGRGAVPVIAGVVVTLCSGWIFQHLYTSYGPGGSELQISDAVLCIGIEAACMVVYWCLWKFRLQQVLPLILCVELTCVSVLSFAPNKDNWTVFSVEYLEAANTAAKSMTTEISDFERIKNMDYKVDHIEYSLVMGEEAISNYWHVIHPDLQPKFSALGYSINWTQLLDTGGTVFTDTLFQTKYFFGKDALPEDLYEYCEDLEYDDAESLKLYRNCFSLPFAIQTDTSSMDVLQERFATQNALFQTITGSADTLIWDVSAEVSNNRYVADIGNEKKLIYFYGTNTSADTFSVTVNGEPVTFPSSSDPEYPEYPVDFCNGIVLLGSFQNETVDIQFFGNGTANPQNIHLGMLDYNTFVNGLEKIKAENATVSELEQKNTGVTLKLENVTKSHVFLPISYDEGWQCKVNGTRVELGNIDGMLSVPVEAGEDTIVLKYVAPGQGLGGIISVCALLVLVAFYVADKKRILQMARVTNVCGSIAYVVFVAVFAAFLVILFVIPVLCALKRVLFMVE